MPASYRGSQVFIYHANAVDGFRRQVLAPWFKKYAATKGISLDEVSNGTTHAAHMHRSWDRALLLHC